jgi:hypothetical protein
VDEFPPLEVWGAGLGTTMFFFFNESTADEVSSLVIEISAAGLPPPLFIRKKANAKLTAITVAYNWVVVTF